MKRIDIFTMFTIERSIFELFYYFVLKDYTYFVSVNVLCPRQQFFSHVETFSWVEMLIYTMQHKQH